MSIDWPLINDEDPMTRAIGLYALVTGVYWLIAPLILLSEALSDIFEQLFEQEDEEST